MKPADNSWRRLVAWARQATPAESLEIPPGFATRVLACRKPAVLKDALWCWEWCSTRAVVCAAVLTLASLLFYTRSASDNTSAYDFTLANQTVQTILSP